MSDCASGCKVRREHHSGCDQKVCTGCMPRLAEFGTLCMACHGRLTRDLIQAPALVEYLRGMLTPGQPGTESRVTSTREQPSVLNLATVDGADELHAALASWAHLVVEEHPGRLVGPDLRGSWVTQASRRRFLPPGLTAEQQVTYGVQYLPAVVAGVKPRARTNPTKTLTAWLLAHAEWIERQPWAAEMVREIGGTIATLRARFPQAEQSQHVTDEQCPNCERVGTLVYNPPTQEGGKIMVQCEHPSCGHLIPEERWGIFVAMIVDARSA